VAGEARHAKSRPNEGTQPRGIILAAQVESCEFAPPQNLIFLDCSEGASNGGWRLSNFEAAGSFSNPTRLRL